MREVKDLRLFFALWPDERVRDSIEGYLASFPLSGGRVIPRHNWHMTLHFIGNTSFDEKGCLDRQARKVSATSFSLGIDQTGFFRKPKVFWLGCQKSPQALFDLQKDLGKQISRCEYQPETRPYSPHVTVARKVLQPPQHEHMAAINWQIDSFVLVESVSEVSGVRYRVLEEYLLR